MPGRVTLVAPTMKASEAVTKNQPPAIDIIMFQISAGAPNGASSRQNFCQGVSPNALAASSRSRGMVFSDW